MDLVVGIDASRNRSGGAVEYLRMILSLFEVGSFGISRIHLWAPRVLQREIDDKDWLVRHEPKVLDGPLHKQLIWQRFLLNGEAVRCGCDVLFSADGATLSKFSNLVVLNQDLLGYEKAISRLYPFGWEMIRLHAIRAVQNAAFRRAKGAIFLTGYALGTVGAHVALPRSIIVIPHGVSDGFRCAAQRPASRIPGALRCVYLSNSAPYKHQREVCLAVAELRRRGRSVTLTLIGGGGGFAAESLSKLIARVDPQSEYIEQLPFLNHKDLPAILSSFDIFVFASSCEAFGISLVEGMALGLPVACSNRSALQEVAADAPLYFDPMDPISIAAAIDKLIIDPKLRSAVGARASEISKRYSWSETAHRTWTYLAECARVARGKVV